MRTNNYQLWHKIILVPLIVGITLSSVFSYPLTTKASETYQAKITGNDVRFRSQPTTANNSNGSNNIITYLDIGTIVTVLSKDKVSGSGCNDGWYNVSYNNTNGYICSSYVSFDTTDSYDRPWTSPKKAIVGGAKFIAGSYIARGQFTSYLKKFNVNPNGYYDMFNHQYMANLAAPSSEAKTSWKTYQNNGLANLPLSFSIPVFLNMADNYNRPGGNLINVELQDEVTDADFEKKLDEQGFSESYKKALRALHTKHSNWTFTAMQTNVNFTDAVAREKIVSSIQGGTQYYQSMSRSDCSDIYRGTYMNNSYCQTESNWFIANDETVAYYLDPRNFLTETYILQFESLESSDNYTESVVQNILNNTFMADLSILDNQKYSSIFVEAGKIANISAVYLASLAIQESGTVLKSNTNGAAFEYKGVNYSGLYNFFNIGASSSESNPSKAGLVYASGGFCTLCSNDNSNNNNNNNDDSTPSTPAVTAPENNSPSTPETPSVPAKNLNNYVSEAGLKVNGSYVTGLNLGQSISDLRNQLKNNDITINSSTDKIGTGTTITYNGETYTIVMYGDLDGDGSISSADLLKMRQHLLGSVVLKDAYYKAGSITGSNISSADLLKMRQHLLGTSSISQI